MIFWAAASRSGNRLLQPGCTQVQTAVRAGGAVLLLALCSGCWVTQAVGYRIQQDMRAISQDVAQLQNQTAQRTQKLADAIQRADALIQQSQDALDSFGKAARSTDAGFGLQLEQVIGELQQIQGQLETMAYRVDRLESGQGIAQNGQDTDKKAREAIFADPPPETPAKNKRPEPAKDDAQGWLKYAAVLAKDGDLDASRKAYGRVLRSWPKKQAVADRAYFYLGELDYYQGRCQPAITHYLQIIDGFAQGSYVDSAYYKLGLCSLKFKNTGDARAFFEVILERKKSPKLVREAQKQLNALKAQKSKSSQSKKKEHTRSKK